MNSRFLLVLIALLLGAWTVVFRHTFEYDWFYDDYHLIRPYSAAELTSTLAGPWDVDGLETPGYRPGLTLFHHLRARWFGESVRSQRAFQVLLMGAFLYLLGRLLFALGHDRLTVASLFAALSASRIFSTHLLFLADGRQLVSSMLMAAIALILLGSLNDHQRRHRGAALFLAAAALLVHEDAYVLAPFLAVLCSSRLSRRAGGTILAIALLTCAHIGLRAILVPAAPGLLQSPIDALSGCILQVRMSLFNFGDLSQPSFDVPNLMDGNLFQTSSRAMRYMMSAHALILGSVAGAAVFSPPLSSALRLPRPAACGLILCLPGLVVPRADLVFMPTIFFLLAFILALRQSWSAAFGLPRRVFVGLIASGWVLLAAGGIWRSLAQAEDYHPLSVNGLIIANELAYGEYSAVRVPEERKRRLLKRLEAQNIHGYRDGSALAQAVSKDPAAFAANRKAKASVFIPLFAFMTP